MRQAPRGGRLKVVVAHSATNLNPAVRAALESEGIEARFCDTSADVEAYWRLLCVLWREGETTVLLEGDKVPVPGAVRAIYDCPSQWCAYPVPMQNGQYCDFPTLACVKFGADLMARLPHVIEREVGTIGIGGGDVPPRHWQRLDMALTLWLHQGRGVCWHPKGMVRHEHKGELTNG